jgi:hypothetical protein
MICVKTKNILQRQTKYEDTQCTVEALDLPRHNLVIENMCHAAITVNVLHVSVDV